MDRPPGAAWRSVHFGEFSSLVFKKQVEFQALEWGEYQKGIISMDESNRIQAHKQAAVQFLQLVASGQVEAAYQSYVDMQGKHHNAYFPAGFPALKQGMLENQAQFPEKRFVVKNVIGDGDLVAVQSHMIPEPGSKGVALIHIFRFASDRIVELWDYGQPVPDDIPNQDGVF